MRALIPLWLLLLLLPRQLSGQESSQRMQQLEEKRKSLMESIEITGDKLDQTRQTGLELLSTLTQLSAQVTARKKFIDAIDAEIQNLERQEKQQTTHITKLEKELQHKQTAYGNAIRKMYSKSSHMEKLMFLLSAENLSQAYRRMRYLREYTSWRKSQADDIVEKQNELMAKRKALQQSKAEKQTVLQERQKERQKLSAEEAKQKQLVERAKKEERSLQAELTKQQKQARELDKQIERIILEEAAARRAEQNRAIAQKLRSKTQTKEPEQNNQSIVEAKPEVKGGYAMTKAELSLSADFSKNRGRLPLPLSSGRCTVVGHFGQQKHEQLKYVTTKNSGIDLQTTAGTEARAVFNGVVSRVFAIPGSNKSVIIRHGNYLTVYSNLTEVTVKAGDKISTKQILGKIFTDPMQQNRTILHFQLWKETTKLDPEPWLNL